MKLRHPFRAGLVAGVFAAVLSLASVSTQSQDHQVFINGQPMHPAVVSYIQQATGVFLPGGAYAWDGQYLYDGFGNSVPLSLSATGPSYYPNGTIGETYPNGSSWGNANTGIGGVYDSGGGCEGGSCVNIID